MTKTQLFILEIIWFSNTVKRFTQEQDGRKQIFYGGATVMRTTEFQKIPKNYKINPQKMGG